MDDQEMHRFAVSEGMVGVRWHDLGAAPCFSGSAGFAPSLSSSHYPAYPMPHPEPEIIRYPEYVFVAQCKNCQREYHLDPDRPIPPAFCGLGLTHGCGSSEWRVFKRLIEVEEDPEYQDDCVYSDSDAVPGTPCSEYNEMRLEKHYRKAPHIPGIVSLPPHATEEEVNMLRWQWEAVIRRVRTEAFGSLGTLPAGNYGDP